MARETCQVSPLQHRSCHIAGRLASHPHWLGSAVAGPLCDIELPPRLRLPLFAQEFLKRIPSSNSLAAFGGHGGSQADLAAQAAQLHSLQASLASQATNLHSASAPPDASGASPSGAGGGVPRVASLDFFRQLLPVNQLNVSGARPAAGSTGVSECASSRAVQPARHSA